MKKTNILKKMLYDKNTTKLVGAHNAVSAKLIEQNNFDGIWASGFEIATTYGVPDTNILSLSEAARSAEIICNSVDIPVLVDCDSGFGNCHNVIHMIKIFERYGAAGVCIEDKLFPKVNSFIDYRQELVDTDEFCGRIMSANDMKKDDDFVVVARIEALISGHGIDVALERAYKYEKAGANALLIHSKKGTPEEIADFMGKWKGKLPIIIVPTMYPIITTQDIQQLNISAVIYANYVLRSMVKAANSMLELLYKSSSPINVDNYLATMDDIFKLQDITGFNNNENLYLNKQYIKNRLGENMLGSVR